MAKKVVWGLLVLVLILSVPRPAQAYYNYRAWGYSGYMPSSLAEWVFMAEGDQLSLVQAQNLSMLNGQMALLYRAQIRTINGNRIWGFEDQSGWHPCLEDDRGHPGRVINVARAAELGLSGFTIISALTHSLKWGGIIGAAAAGVSVIADIVHNHRKSVMDDTQSAMNQGRLTYGPPPAQAAPPQTPEEKAVIKSVESVSIQPKVWLINEGPDWLMISLVNAGPTESKAWLDYLNGEGIPNTDGVVQIRPYGRLLVLLPGETWGYHFELEGLDAADNGDLGMQYKHHNHNNVTVTQVNGNLPTWIIRPGYKK